MSIITGKEISGSPVANSIFSSRGPTPIYSQLFNRYSTVGESEHFTVRPGEIVNFNLYSLSDLDAEDKVYLEQLCVATYDPPNGESCPPCGNTPRHRELDLLAWKRMDCVDRNMWVLCSERTQFMLVIPGRYRFTTDIDIILNKGIILESIRWKMVDTPYLPKEYFGGIGGSIAACGGD